MASTSSKNRGQSEPSNAVNAQLSVQIGGVTQTVGTARELATTYQVSQATPLPPGIRKQLARGKPLPPGIAKQRLPANYVQQLPVREGCEWSQVGSGSGVSRDRNRCGGGAVKRRVLTRVPLLRHP